MFPCSAHVLRGGGFRKLLGDAPLGSAPAAGLSVLSPLPGVAVRMSQPGGGQGKPLLGPRLGVLPPPARAHWLLPPLRLGKPGRSRWERRRSSASVHQREQRAQGCEARRRVLGRRASSAHPLEGAGGSKCEGRGQAKGRRGSHICPGRQQCAVFGAPQSGEKAPEGGGQLRTRGRERAEGRSLPSLAAAEPGDGHSNGAWGEQFKGNAFLPSE